MATPIEQSGAHLQALVDAGGLVELPAGRFKLPRPLRVSRDGTVLRGQGPDNTVLTLDFDARTAGTDVVRIGRRKPGVMLAPDFVHLSGVAGLNLRGYGLRLDGSNQVYCGVGSPICLQPIPGAPQKYGHYCNVRKFTLAVIWLPSPGAPGFNGYHLAGLIDGDTPSPIALQCWPGEGHAYRLALNTNTPAGVIGLPMPLGDWLSGRPQRVEYHVDLDAGTWGGTVNGVATAGTIDPATGLAANEFGVFSVGGGGRLDNRSAARGIFIGGRLTLACLTDMVGRTDADFLGCYGLGPETHVATNAAGFGPFDAAFGREQRQTQYANWTDVRIEASPDIVQGARVEGVGLDGWHYGSGLSIERVNDFTASGCRLNNSAYAVGTGTRIANYLVTLRECQVNGDDSALMAHFTTMQMLGCRLGGGGRHVLHASDADLYVESMLCDQPRLFAGSWCRFVASGGHPTRLLLSRVGIDDESNPGQAKAGCVVEFENNGDPTKTLVSGWGCSFPPNMFKAGAPVVKLTNAAAQVWFDGSSRKPAAVPWVG